MLASSFLNYRIILSLAVSALAGLALLVMTPVFNKHPQMLLVLPMAGAFFLMLVINPRWTFILVFLTRPLLDKALNLTRISLGGQDIGFGAILNLIIIVLAVFLIFYEGIFSKKNPLLRYWVIFLLVMFVAVLDSPYIGRAARLYANYLSYFAMYLVPFLIIKDRKDFIFWLKIFAWSFVLPVLYADIDLLRGGKFYTDAGNRILGTFSHPNILAFYLCLGIAYYFYLIKSGFIKTSRFVKMCVVILVLNMVILLIATKTRNAWIACFLGFAIYGLLKDRKTLLLLFVMLPALLLVPTVKDRVITVLNGQGSVDYKGINSMEWRLRMWKSSIPMIAQKPLQGYGLSSFVPMSAQFSDVGTNGAHNVYLETLFESGIFGLLSLLALLFKPLILFLQYMQRASHRQAVLWAVVVGYLISYIIMCSADNLSYYLVFNWYVWFFIGLMLVAKRYVEPAGAKERSAPN